MAGHKRNVPGGNAPAEPREMLPLTKALAIENTFHVKRLARAAINLDETPVDFDKVDVFSSNGGVTRLTNLNYCVCYMPRVRGRSIEDWRRAEEFVSNRPFVVFCDMFAPKGVARFKDWDDFSSSEHPVAIWLLRNTKVSRETFEFARSNPYVNMPFCINYSAYHKNVGTRDLFPRYLEDVLKGDIKP